MSTIEKKIQCFSCNKQTRTLNCAGCSKDFCMNCLPNHLQMLSKELDEIEYNHDLFRQIINERKHQSENDQLIKEIDQWEENSIKKIKQTGEECRQTLINHKTQVYLDIENKLNDIAIQLRIIRQENQFNEIDIDQFKNKFSKLQDELDRLSNLSIQQQSSPFINKILVHIPLNHDNWNLDKKWKQNGITIAGGNGSGNKLNQLSYPFSMAIIDEKTILISDSGNDRIVQWKSDEKNTRIIACAEQNNQLFGPADFLIDKQNETFILAEYGNRRVTQWSYQNTSNPQIIISDIYCVGLAIDKNGFLYASNYETNEVKQWKIGESQEKIVAGGNGIGDQLNQLNGPTFIFVDDDQSIYISDEKNHRIMKWIKDAKEGIVVAGGNGQGNSLKELSFPQGVIVDQSGRIYVADRDNYRIMCWTSNSSEGTVIVGGNGKGNESNQFNSPIYLSFDQQGNLYVVDHENHRIQMFEKE